MRNKVIGSNKNKTRSVRSWRRTRTSVAAQNYLQSTNSTYLPTSVVLDPWAHLIPHLLAGAGWCWLAGAGLLPRSICGESDFYLYCTCRWRGSSYLLGSDELFIQ